MAEKERGACIPAPQSLKSQRGSRGVSFRGGVGASGFVSAGGRRSKPTAPGSPFWRRSIPGVVVGMQEGPAGRGGTPALPTPGWMCRRVRGGMAGLERSRWPGAVPQEGGKAAQV